MYGVEKKPDVSVEAGQDVIVIRRKGVSKPTVAHVLKSETHGNRTRIVLDRLVHRPHEVSFGNWHVSGAYTTVLVYDPANLTKNAG